MKFLIYSLCALFFAFAASLASANSAVVPVPRAGDWWEHRHQGYVSRAHEGNINVLFLGDSITQNWRSTDPKKGGRAVWEREFAPLKAACFGIASDCTQNVLWRLQNGEAEGYQPKAVVLLIGTNNTGNRNTPQEAAAGVGAVLEELKTRFPAAKILLLSLLPRGDHPQSTQVVAINKLLPDLADGQRVIFVDIWAKFLNESGDVPPDIMPDLIHPNLQGYEIFAAAIRQPLISVLGN